MSSYRRSPKSLADLACDAVCRSLPDMQGELPPGLPQDVVDDIFNSLIEHSALNATTLHALKNCELFSLPLTNCRGVTDEWLMPLSVRSSTCNSSATSINGSLSPIPYPTTPPQATMMRRGAILLPTDNMSSMDFDDSNDQNATFFATLDAQDDAESDQTVEDSSFSTSSFVSASSNYETMNSLLTSDVDDPTAMKCGLHRQHHITNLNSVETHLTNDSIMESLSDDIPEKDEERRPSMDETEVSDDLTIKMRACDSPLQQPYTPIAPEGYSLPSSFPGSIGSFEPQISFARNVKLLDLRGCQHLSDRGLLQLTDLSKLEVARFDNCHSITGRGLSALSNSRQLHTLSLVNCRRLTDEGIIHISRFLLTLECLILDGCRCITDRSMDAMSALSNLKTLDLSQCDLITDDGLKRLELLRELQVLSLGWCRKVTNEGLNTFTSHQERSMKMRVLRLSRCSSITDVGIAYVSRLSCLEELDLNGCTSVSSNALGNALQKLNHLHTLDVSYCPGIM